MRLLITHNDTVVAAQAIINTVDYVRNLIKNKDKVFLKIFSLEKLYIVHWLTKDQPITT